MAKCHICGSKDDVIMAECARCREIMAEQMSDREIEDIWEEAGKRLETKGYSAIDFEDWA
jgi:transcription initiation factor TFIIIB Brf1 subunit/transcription initiation factor TFIIB